MSKILKGAEEALIIAKGGKPPARASGPAMWTYDFEATAWYVRLEPREAPPYLRQVHVDAILDIGANGTVAGIEIIDDKAPGPNWRGHSNAIAQARAEGERAGRIAMREMAAEVVDRHTPSTQDMLSTAISEAIDRIYNEILDLKVEGETP